MTRTSKYLDGTSWIVVFITVALFVAAVFVKGFGHDLLLEAGVFLVSLKLILMSYKHSVTDEQLSARLQELSVTLARMDARLGTTAGAGDATPGAPPEGEAEIQRTGNSKGRPS
jgi:hypothetical protein